MHVQFGHLGMRCDLPHLQNCAKYAINGSNLFNDIVKDKKIQTAGWQMSIMFTYNFYQLLLYIIHNVLMYWNNRIFKCVHKVHTVMILLFLYSVIVEFVT